MTGEPQKVLQISSTEPGLESSVTVASSGRRAVGAPVSPDTQLAVEIRQLVESGELELECTRGGSRKFPRGAILWFAGLPLRTLRNRGLEPVVLTAVSRAAMSFVPPPGLSCGVDREPRGEHHD